MRPTARTVEQILDQQVRRWEMDNRTKAKPAEPVSVICVSRQPGSRGRLIARFLADALGYDLFDRDLIQRIAESADMSREVVNSLDERSIGALENWLRAFVNERNLFPDQFLNHLLKVIGAIGRQGRAVIVGRGGHAILPPDRCFRVRFVAPLDHRVRFMSQLWSIPEDETRSRVIALEAERAKFMRQHFNADIDDPTQYDLIVNTMTMTESQAVETVLGGFRARKS